MNAFVGLREDGPGTADEHVRSNVYIHVVVDPKGREQRDDGAVMACARMIALGKQK